MASVAAVAGLALRFVAPSPLWLDEALSVHIASLPLADAVQALRHDGHPLLYYALLGFWLDAIGDSDAGVRSLSALFSVAAVGPVWAATRRRLGPPTARYAAVLAATSPFLIRYGSEARMYALVVLVAATGWWLTDAAIEEPKRWRLAALGLTVAAGLHTHYWMIWLAVAASTLLAAQWLAHPDRRRTLTPVLAAFGCGGIAFVPWVPVLAEQAAHTGTPWAKWARPAEVAIESIEGMGGGARFEPMLLGVVLLGAIGLGATLLRTGDGTLELAWPGRHAGAALVAVVGLTLGVGGLVAMATASAFEARYIAVVVPMALALAGRGLAGLPGRAAAAALAAVAVLSVAVAIDDIRRDRSQGEQAADAIDSARLADGSADDVLVICPDQLAPAVLRYVDAPMTTLTYPPTADARLVDWYDYRQRIDEAAVDQIAAEADSASGSGTVWLAMAPGYHGFGKRCEDLAATLGNGRGSETVVAARPVYEPMTLLRYETRR